MFDGNGIEQANCIRFIQFFTFRQSGVKFNNSSGVETLQSEAKQSSNNKMGERGRRQNPAIKWLPHKTTPKQKKRKQLNDRKKVSKETRKEEIKEEEEEEEK